MPETSSSLHSFKRIAKRSQVLEAPFSRFQTDGKEYRYEVVAEFSAVLMTNLNGAAVSEFRAKVAAVHFCSLSFTDPIQSIDWLRIGLAVSSPKCNGLVSGSKLKAVEPLRASARRRPAEC